MSVSEIVAEYRRLSLAAKALGEPIAYVVYPDAVPAFLALNRAIEESQRSFVRFTQPAAPIVEK